MHLVGLFFALFLQSGPETPPRITAAVDLAGWVARGSATAELPLLHSGRMEFLFDGNPSTAALCGDEGAAAFTFSFDEAVPLRQIGIHLGGGGVFRWRAETLGGRDGRTAQPLISWRYTEADQRDPVPLGGAVTVLGLRIEVERLTLAGGILVREIECYTTLELTRLGLREKPDTAMVESPLFLSPVAYDSRGGVLPLDEGVAWEHRPRGLLKPIGARGFIPLYAGKASIRFTFLSLTSPDYALTIVPPEEAPVLEEATPFFSTARIGIAAASDKIKAFAVYARLDGEGPPADPVLTTDRSLATLHGLSPGTAYHLSTAGLDSRGIPVTKRSEERRIRTLTDPPPGLETMAELHLLVVIYGEGYDEREIEGMERGFEEARLFLFRSSRARLHVDTRYLVLDGPVPAGGPGMEAIEEDLVHRGALAGLPGAVHVVARNLDVNRSGYLFENGAIGSFGSTAFAAYGGEAEMDAAACWTLVHELQHSIEWITAQGGGSMLGGHFLQNYPLSDGGVFDAGDFYDGQREIFRLFDGYLSLPPPWIQPIEVIDVDGDGMPDRDARLPCDETRFGSDPSLRDTDSDGLDDLQEFHAGLYQGTDPRLRDTDEDGLDDGVDPYPLSSFTGTIPRGTTIRGQIPAAMLLRVHRFDTTIHASWDRDRLYLAFESDRPIEVLVEIDGSGRLGPFESDRIIMDPLTAEPCGDIYVGDHALKAAFGAPGLLCGHRAVPGAVMVSARRKEAHLLWLSIPAALGPGTPRCHFREGAIKGDGLSLTEGRVMGFAFKVWALEGDGEAIDLMEPHRLYDAVLTP